MKDQHEWECWTLSIEDIKEAAKRAGVPAHRLSTDDCFEIARRFKKGMAWAMDDWILMLQDAVTEVWNDKSQIKNRGLETSFSGREKKPAHQAKGSKNESKNHQRGV